MFIEIIGMKKDATPAGVEFLIYYIVAIGMGCRWHLLPQYFGFDVHALLHLLFIVQ